MYFYRNIRRESGFTLIELLVVIAIIGILSTIVLSSLDTARMRSRDARRLQDMRQASTAVELYANTTGSFPAHGGTSYGCTDATCLTTLTDELVPNYISSIPLDPLYGNTTTGYRYCQSGGQYALLMWSEKKGTWCSYAHGSNIRGTACWFINGVPTFGWCHETM